VHDVCGIVPAPSECRSFLDTNSGQIQGAARMLHATLEAELWQRGIMSTEQRGVAALIRNETGRFPSVGSIDFYLHNNGSIESAATLLLVEYANQELRDYTESVQTHHRQQLAHMYNQRRPSAHGLGGVDVATEQSVEGGGLGTQMVRNEGDLVQHWKKLVATDGSSATVPSVDPLSSTATPSAFASDLHRDPELQAMYDALLPDGHVPAPFTSDDSDPSPLKSEGEPSHCCATSTLLKSNDGTPMCFINNSIVTPPAKPVYSPPWFKPGSKTRENPITGQELPLNFEDMSSDLKVLAAQPSPVRPHEYVFLGNQRRGAKDKSGMVYRRAANNHAGETGAS
jgi:hypothetical protein